MANRIESEKESLQDHFRVIEELGGIEHLELKNNGLRVLLLQQHAAPVVAFMVTYHVGSRNESTGLTGATHFLEHLMFKGTEKFNKEKGTSVFNVLQAVGAQMNATTWMDRTNYYEMLPKEHLGLAIEIEADRMRGARLAADDMESERTVILNEFDRGENEPFRKLYHSVWTTAYQAHPYHHPTIGWRSDIEQVTPDGLRHFYDTYYWPNNATLSVIGDYERDAALQLILDHFGPIPSAGHEIPDVMVREPEQKGQRRITVKKSGELGAMLMGYKVPEGLHDDADALDVLGIILGSGKNSRLFRNLTDKGLTTHVYASGARFRDPGLFTIYAFLSPEKTHEEVESAIWAILEDIKENGVEQSELERALNLLNAQASFERDGPFSIAAQLNEAIAAGDWKLYAQFNERVKQVTTSDIQRVARQYFEEDASTIGWYIPV
ncbi:MAG: insulinase family protein [Rhodothermaceae bacterium]|nr:insulinase family protein [Rhodothermaceae bacterium]